MSDRNQRQRQRATQQPVALRTQINTEIPKLSALIEADILNEQKLEVQLQIVLHVNEQILALDSEVMDFILETEEDMQVEIDETTTFQSEVLGVTKLAETLIKNLSRNTNGDAGSVASFTSAAAPLVTRTQAKLPKLELPSLSGDAIKWQSFWDSFESKVHADALIPDVDKLHYLLKLLKGEAADTVTGYRPTASNYPVVVSVLQERFGNPETAKFRHFVALFSLPSAETDTSRLKEIYNECEKHIRCLVALGLTEDTFGQVFVPLILSKLPRTTRLQLHRSQGTKDWDLQSLRNLMKQEILARDLTDRFSKGGFGTTQKPAQEKNEASATKGSNQHPNKSKGTAKNWVTQGSLVAQNSGQQVKCVFCGSSHFSDSCTKFAMVDSCKSVLENRCFKCLGSGHRVSNCKRPKPCFYCKGKDHHSSLCYKHFATGATSTDNGTSSSPSAKDSQSTTAPSSNLSKSQTTMLANSQLGLGRQTVLKMATVKYPSLTRPARIYFDDGSSTSYVTSQFARQVGIQFSGYQYISVGRFGSNKRQNKRFKTALLPIPLSDGTTFTLPVNIIDTMTTKVQRVPLDPKKYPALEFLPLADTQNPSFQKVSVDILIGGDSLHELFTGERISVTDGLFLYGSKLGYVAAGSVEVTDYEDSFNQTTAVCLFSQATAFRTPQLEVERFWSLEDLGIKDNPYVTDDELALDRFQQTVRKVDGRYEVGLPWRHNNELPDHYGLAAGRLPSLQRRLKQQEDVLLQYDSILNEQAKTGIIEEVKQARTDNKVHYIPHHCVFRSDSSTTKLRIVYDASAKLSRHSPSLNESLLRGPVTIQNLCGFLLRFRISPLAMLCDIEKAFHQISIRLQDRDALRFLWIENPLDPVTKSNLRTFRFCRVPFGMICSPFLLDGCIRHHLSSKHTEMADDILKNMLIISRVGSLVCLTQ